MCAFARCTSPVVCVVIRVLSFFFFPFSVGLYFSDLCSMVVPFVVATTCLLVFYFDKGYYKKDLLPGYPWDVPDEYYEASSFYISVWQNGVYAGFGVLLSMVALLKSRFNEYQERKVCNTRQGKTRQDKARQGKTRQGKTRQGKTRQDKARQGKARQDKTRRVSDDCVCPAGRFVSKCRIRVDQVRLPTEKN